MKEAEFESFRLKLEQEYSWPALYTFKFICPKDKTEEVKEIFSNHEVKERPSRNGNFVSLTIKIMAGSSDIIIQRYLDVNEVPGIISL